MTMNRQKINPVTGCAHIICANYFGHEYCDCSACDGGLEWYHVDREKLNYCPFCGRTFDHIEDVTFDEWKKSQGVVRMAWRDEPVTKKQLEYIWRMQEDAGMNGAIPLPEFTGRTKGEASDWIDANKGKQYEAFDYYSHGDNYGDR